MVGPIWLRKSASKRRDKPRPQNTPMMKAVGQRLIQPIRGQDEATTRPTGQRDQQQEVDRCFGRKLLGMKLASPVGKKSREQIGHDGFPKPITIQYAAEGPPQWPRPLCTRGCRPARTRRCRASNCAPHKPAVREKSGRHPVRVRPSLGPSLTLTASCSVHRTSEPSSRVWTCSSAWSIGCRHRGGMPRIQDRNRDANEHQQNAKGCVASSSCMSHASPRFRAMKYTKLPTKIRPTIKM